MFHVCAQLNLDGCAGEWPRGVVLTFDQALDVTTHLDAALDECYL